MRQFVRAVVVFRSFVLASTLCLTVVPCLGAPMVAPDAVGGTNPTPGKNAGVRTETISAAVLIEVVMLSLLRL